VRAAVIQALVITGSVPLLLGGNDEESESIERKSVPGHSAMFSGPLCVNLLLHKSENSVLVPGGGIVLLGVFIQTLGTFGSTMLLVEPDGRETLPSIMESKFVPGGEACGCDT
jgi:hypothetical protein